jgi:hypothetical protein
MLTRVKTGRDEISTYTNKKDGITVQAMVSASIIKWPLYFLATGKPRSYEQAGGDNHVITSDALKVRDTDFAVCITEGNGCRFNRRTTIRWVLN